MGALAKEGAQPLVGAAERRTLPGQREHEQAEGAELTRIAIGRQASGGGREGLGGEQDSFALVVVQWHAQQVDNREMVNQMLAAPDEMDAAVQFGLDSPFPEPEAATNFVYA